jgi:hypothetical protein
MLLFDFGGQKTILSWRKLVMSGCRGFFCKHSTFSCASVGGWLGYTWWSSAGYSGNLYMAIAKGALIGGAAGLSFSLLVILVDEVINKLRFDCGNDPGSRAGELNAYRLSAVV